MPTSRGIPPRQSAVGKAEKKFLFVQHCCTDHQHQLRALCFTNHPVFSKTRTSFAEPPSWRTNSHSPPAASSQTRPWLVSRRAPYPSRENEKAMKAAIVCSTAAGAACCGLAGVGAFLPTPTPVSRGMVWRNSAYRFDATGSGGGNGGGAAGAGPGGEEFGSAALGGRGGSTGGERRGAGKRHRATTLGNLDLKPAYRLFDTVPPPSAMEAARTSDAVDLDVMGKAPYCEFGGSLLFYFQELEDGMA